MSGLPGAATPQPTLCLPLRSCTPASGKVLWKEQTADTSLKSGEAVLDMKVNGLRTKLSYQSWKKTGST